MGRLQVTNMSFIFVGDSESPSVFNRDVSKWDVSRVRHVEHVFLRPFL